jgi:long-subunit fatty acid transport protein
MKRAVVVGVATGVFFLGAGQGAALDLGEWVPGLKVSPFLSQRFEYDSNVFQTPSNEEDDFISKTIPGFLAEYSFGPHSLSLGYRAEILEYFQLTEQDTVNHIALGEVRLDFPRLLAILRDDFVHTSDPPNTELTGPITSDTNTLTSSVEYRFTPRLSAGLSASWTYINFEPQVNDLDRNDFLFGATVYWKFVPRADVSLGYAYGFKNFTVAGDRDVTRNIVTVGLRGEITPKLSSTFRAGYEIREGEKRSDTDFSGLTLGGGFEWRPTERTTFTLGVDRSVQESVFQTSPDYVTTGGSLAVQQLFGKVTASARLAGGYNDYATKQTVGTQTDFRHDWYWGAGAGLDYDFRTWLRFGAEYLYLGRNSNFDTFDFHENRVAVKATLQF